MSASRQDLEFLRSLARTLCLTPKDDDFYLVNEAWIAAIQKLGIDDTREKAMLAQAEQALRLDGFTPT